MTGIRNFVAALTLSTLGTILFHLIFNQKFNLFYYYLAPSTSKLVSNETELIKLSLKHQNYELTYNGNQKNLSCSDINSKTISKIEKFVFFFGFSHCGSTATSSIIDAHPNALIANELDLLESSEITGSDKNMLRIARRICKVSHRWEKRAGNSLKGIKLIVLFPINFP